MGWPQVAGIAGTLLLMVFFIAAYTWTTLSDWRFNRRLKRDYPDLWQKRLDREANRKQGN